MSDLKIDYRLPVTTVTIGGTRTKVDNPVVTPRQSITRSSHVAVEIVADPNELRSITVADPQLNKRTIKVGLLPDGRLKSVNSTIEDHSDERLKAAVTLGLQTAGALSPLATTGPVGIAAAALGAVAAGAIAYSVNLAVEGDLSDVLGDGADATRPSPAELGIDSRYVTDHKSDAEVLANFRWSEMLLVVQESRLTTGHAVNSPKGLADDLRAINRALSHVRAGLAGAERKYAVWVGAHAEVTEHAQFDETFLIQELPSTESLHQAAAEGFPFNGLDGDGTGTSARWSALFEDLRIGVSCDFLESPPSSQDASPGEHGVLAFRRQELAILTTWAIEREDDRKFRLTPTSVERKVVVRSDRGEQHLSLLANKEDGALSVSYDADGLVDEISSDRSDPKVKQQQVLSALPALAKDAFESGAALSAPFTTSTRVQEMENRRKLNPAADPLQQLRDDLEKAELQARLARARMVVSDPTRGLFQMTLTEAEAG